MSLSPVGGRRSEYEPCHATTVDTEDYVGVGVVQPLNSSAIVRDKWNDTCVKTTGCAIIHFDGKVIRGGTKGDLLQLLSLKSGNRSLEMLSEFYNSRGSRWWAMRRAVTLPSSRIPPRISCSYFVVRVYGSFVTGTNPRRPRDDSISLTKYDEPRTRRNLSGLNVFTKANEAVNTYRCCWNESV